jgi:hypothetical protein
VGLVGGDVAFVAVDVLRARVGPTGLFVHVWDVAAGERLELLDMVAEAFIGFS